MTRQIHRPLVKPDRAPRPSVPPVGSWVESAASGVRGQVRSHHTGNRGLLVEVGLSDGRRAWFLPCELRDAGV